MAKVLLFIIIFFLFRLLCLELPFKRQECKPRCDDTTTALDSGIEVEVEGAEIKAYLCPISHNVLWSPRNYRKSKGLIHLGHRRWTPQAFSGYLLGIYVTSIVFLIEKLNTLAKTLTSAGGLAQTRNKRSGYEDGLRAWICRIIFMSMEGDQYKLSSSFSVYN